MFTTDMPLSVSSSWTHAWLFTESMSNKGMHTTGRGLLVPVMDAWLCEADDEANGEHGGVLDESDTDGSDVNEGKDRKGDAWCLCNEWGECGE